jgi:hypothetical protein
MNDVHCSTRFGADIGWVVRGKKDIAWVLRRLSNWQAATRQGDLVAIQHSLIAGIGQKQRFVMTIRRCDGGDQDHQRLSGGTGGRRWQL